MKNPLYAVIMNVIPEVNPNEVLERYKDMGKVKLNENNREFLLDMMKKLELDKKLKEEGIERGIERGIEEGKSEVASSLRRVTVTCRTGKNRNKVSNEQSNCSVF